MDTESIEMMLETVTMARESLADVIASAAEADPDSLFDDDNEAELHQVSVGIFETLKMTAEFTECDIVTSFCEDLSTDFFEFKPNQEELISPDQGQAFSDWLLALEQHLDSNNDADNMQSLLAPFGHVNQGKYKSLLNGSPTGASNGALDSSQAESVEQTTQLDTAEPSETVVDSSDEESVIATDDSEEQVVEAFEDTTPEKLVDTIDTVKETDKPAEFEFMNGVPPVGAYVPDPDDEVEAEVSVEELEQEFAKELDTADETIGDDADTEDDVIENLASEDTAEEETIEDVISEEAERTEVEPSPIAASSAAPEQKFNSAIEQEVVEILTEELTELYEDLEEIEIQMLDGEQMEELRQEASREYAEELRKLSEAYGTMGCNGLQVASSFVQDNARIAYTITGNDEIEAAKTVFSQWSKQFETYLGVSDREPQALELLVLFQSQGWPKPISEQAGDSLYLALLEDFNFAATKQSTEERLEVVTAADVDLTIDPEVSDNVVQSFLQEAPDLAAQFTHTMLALPHAEDVQETLRDGQRTIHTVKGLSTLVAVEGITNLSHNIEDILDHLMSAKITPPAELSDLLGESADTLESMLDYLSGTGSFPDNSEDVLTQILAWAKLCDNNQVENFSPEMLAEVLEDTQTATSGDHDAFAQPMHSDEPGDIEQEPSLVSSELDNDTSSVDTLEADAPLTEEFVVEDHAAEESDELDVDELEAAEVAEEESSKDTEIDETSLEALEERASEETEAEEPVVTTPPSDLGIPLPSSIPEQPPATAAAAATAALVTGAGLGAVAATATSKPNTSLGVQNAAMAQQAALEVASVPILRRVAENVEDAESESRADTGNLNVPVSIIDNLFRSVGEMSVIIGQMQVQVNRVLNESTDIRKHHRVVGQRQFELENVIDVQTAQAAKGLSDLIAKESNSDLDTLEFDQYNELHTSSNAYIETVADMQAMVRSVETESTALRNLVSAQNQLNKQLEELVTSTRLVSSSTLNARMERCVRQASRSTGKKVNLSLSGTETLVDSETLNQLVNPLIHILRNAVDHGIDSEADRLSAGKDAEGQIDLSFNSDGKTISIICDDDGAGINFPAIREKMINNGVIEASEEPDNAQLVNYLFQPGVTTKTHATQLSGRGFGMDIVSEAVRDMDGELEMLENDKGGCRVIIRVPVKLVTSHALHVGVGTQEFSIPSGFVDQIIILSMGNLEQVGKEMTFFYGNQAYPVAYLSDKLNMPPSKNRDSDNSAVLITRSGSESIAVIVDTVIGNHEVVVKSLGRYLSGAFDYISGVATLGDGQLITVLNLPSLLIQRAASAQSLNLDTFEDPAAAVGQGSVLIVEDSLSVRNALSDIVEDAGYSRVLAKDGLQALDLIRSENIGIVLTDLEMPRMDGLELTRQIRSSDAHKELPVLMITSRTMEKHKQLAAEVGVTEYITKPFSENQILDLVNQFIT